MKFSTALVTLALTAGLTSALPQTFPPAPPDTVYYYFRTNVQYGQPPEKSQYNDLYMVAYHTGAGLSDATFENAALPAHRGWFNGTYLNWFEPQSDNGGIFFGVNFGTGTNYAAWSAVTINGGQGTEGLALDDQQNLVFTSDYYNEIGAAWLVCDWYHGVPQLFLYVNNQVGSNNTLPTSCAKVDLVAEVAPPQASSTSS